MASKKDPTEPIRKKASEYPGVDEGTSCTQSSFKAGKKAFLYIGEQGGRYKAMFKLRASLAKAEKLAEDRPDDFQVGAGWVTARFSDDKPMPKRLWESWLDESYALSGGSATKTTKKAKPARKAKASKKTKAVRKAKATRKKTAKKKPRRKA